MTNSNRLTLAAGLLLACGFLLFIAVLATGFARLILLPRTPKPDIASTFRALLSNITPSPAPLTPTFASPASQLIGNIVFTCQIYKYQSSEQICIINADGSKWRRLTPDDGVRHYYPSLALDGQSVVYSQYREDNVYEVYELRLADGKDTQLTNRLGALTGPEISPDGKSIVFMRWTVASNQDQIWMMDRAGSNPKRVFSGTGWDPTWSPDGTQILFASDLDGSDQLYVVNLDGTGLRKITNMAGLRGRSDWSPRNLIVTYAGDAWGRELYVMNTDGSNLHRVSPPGGNSQGPSFSPDGQWIVFTAYFDHASDINGCEIYVIRLDGSGLLRLTNNDYYDYQPRWGP